MKLKVNDWKHAWFESHISDRFFQEMSKLERGTVQGLVTTGQWSEQIMIEVGALAQAMIRLEQDSAPEPQIRQAYDRAMRLAVLAMHLITALDGADREQLRSPSIVQGESRAARPKAGPVATPPPAPPPRAAPDKPPGAGPTTRASGPPAPWLVRGPAPPARTADPARRTAGESAGDVPAEDVLSASPPEQSAPAAPMFSSLVQVSGGGPARSGNHAHQTILSLAEQGLSRAEIEVVTGEPRHVVEAVLNNARSQAIAARRAGA